MTDGDPTRESQWRPLFLLLRRMDAEIEQVYADAGHHDVSARHVLPLVRLDHTGPLTIRGLATECEVTHSAMSQTVAAMERIGLVERVEDPADGRARRVRLTDRGREVAVLGAAEWRATEAAVAELEAEAAYPLSRVVRDLETALEQRSFADRVRAHLHRR